MEGEAGPRGAVVAACGQVAAPIGQRRERSAAPARAPCLRARGDATRIGDPSLLCRTDAPLRVLRRHGERLHKRLAKASGVWQREVRCGDRNVLTVRKVHKRRRQCARRDAIKMEHRRVAVIVRVRVHAPAAPQGFQEDVATIRHAVPPFDATWLERQVGRIPVPLRACDHDPTAAAYHRAPGHIGDAVKRRLVVH